MGATPAWAGLSPTMTGSLQAVPGLWQIVPAPLDYTMVEQFGLSPFLNPNPAKWYSPQQEEMENLYSYDGASRTETVTPPNCTYLLRINGNM